VYPGLSGDVLVTGASGMLGLHVVESLVNRGVNVVSLVNPGSLDKRPWARDILRGTEVVEADIRDRERLKNVLGGRRFESVIHTVAVIGRGRREYNVNYRGTVKANPDPMELREQLPVNLQYVVEFYSR